MTVEPIEFYDVRKNKLLYLKIQDGEKEVLINIGDKTYKAIVNLIEPPQPELPLPSRIENGVPTNTPQTQVELKAKVQGKTNP